MLLTPLVDVAQTLCLPGQDSFRPLSPTDKRARRHILQATFSRNRFYRLEWVVVKSCTGKRGNKARKRAGKCV